MPHVTVNGNEMHYRDTGGDGFPVVLAHGFTGNARNWALTVPALREQFRVVSPDHRGHGHSHKPLRQEDYELERMAEDLYGLIQVLGIEECYLAGHSMGGIVSQLLILEHPELVRALVLVDTAAEVPQTLRAKERYEERQRLVRIAEEHGMGAVFDEQLKAADPRIRENTVFVETWREQFLLTSREAYIYGAHGMASRRSVVGRLGEIRVPALVICGQNDEPFLQPSRDIAAAIPGGELTIIAGAGHTPQIETPAEFNRVLCGWLEKVQAGVKV